MNESIYQSLFNLIHQYVYGGVDLTSDMNLVCTLISTIGVVFLVSIPFIIVKKFIDMVC